MDEVPQCHERSRAEFFLPSRPSTCARSSRSLLCASICFWKGIVMRRESAHSQSDRPSVSVSSAFGSSLAYFDTPVRRVRRPVHSYFPPSLHCICPYPGRTLVRAARPFVPARSLSIRILRDEERWAKVGRSTDERRGGNSLPSFSPSFGPLRPSVRPSVRPSARPSARPIRVFSPSSS